MRAAMPSGVIQIYRSDVILLLTKRLTTLAESVEHEQSKFIHEQNEKKRLQDLEFARGPILAALEVKRNFTKLKLKQKIEKEVFGSPLVEMARDREWKTGGQARILKKAFQMQWKDMYVRKVQRGIRRFLLRLKLQTQNVRAQYRQDCAEHLQRIFRGHLARHHCTDIRLERGLEPIEYPLLNERRCAEKFAFFRKIEVERQTDLIVKADKHCCEEIFDVLLKSVTEQRLAQLQALLNGIKIGTVFCFSFLTVSEEIRLPIKALNRWVGGDLLIKKKKANETEDTFALRVDKMTQVVRDKVLLWYENTPHVQSLVFAWKDDVQLPALKDNLGVETKGSELSRLIPGFGNMKSLRDIFKAAKNAKDMSTRKERMAVIDAAADATRMAAADAAHTKSRDAAIVVEQAHVADCSDSSVRSPACSANEGLPRALTPVEEEILSVLDHGRKDARADRGSVKRGRQNGRSEMLKQDGREVRQQDKASFSLADHINDSTELHDDMRLSEISFDSSLDSIVVPSTHPSFYPSVHLENEEEEETNDTKALNLQTAREAHRRVESRRRLLLEYAHKIELAQTNRGIDARLLFQTMDSNRYNF